MTYKVTISILKAAVFFSFLLVIATGCHTPEDLKEIGPQKPLVEESVGPVINNPKQDKATVVEKKNTARSSSESSGASIEFGSAAIKLKTPFQPSVKIPKPVCKKC